MNTYEELKQIQTDYPALTFKNDGYQYLPKQVREDHAEVIQRVEELLKSSITGFSEFNNFVPNEDGSFRVRVQYNWGAHNNSRQFIGVGYFPIEDFKNIE